MNPLGCPVKLLFLHKLFARHLAHRGLDTYRTDGIALPASHCEVRNEVVIGESVGLKLSDTVHNTTLATNHRRLRSRSNDKVFKRSHTGATLPY